jgi:hypothetical protein
VGEARPQGNVVEALNSVVGCMSAVRTAGRDLKIGDLDTRIEYGHRFWNG